MSSGGINLSNIGDLFSPQGGTTKVSDILGRLTSLGSSSTAGGGGALGAGFTDLSQLRKFFSSLLSGDRTKTMSVLAPQIGTISSQYQAARKSAAENAPRSGGRAAALEESRFKEAGDVQSLLESGQLIGAQGLTDVAKTETATGLGLESIGGQDLATALSGAISRKQLSSASSAGLGAGIGQALAMLMTLTVGGGGSSSNSN